ncbi:MAG: DUF2169 domain-containing protein [Minicystis sp.]
MITRNTTPLLFGTKACSRRPPRPEMTLIAKGVFTLRPGEPLAFVPELDRGSLQADVLPDGDDERRGECLYPSDFANFKLNAEVMLKGTCHPPGGRPVKECGVRVTVGAWAKNVQVIGQRVWTEIPGRPISNPLPFTRMPLTWANSFGGPEHPANPVGTGFQTPKLPTVEHASERIRSRGDRPPPAAFGPINPQWPPRARKVGKAYGKKYVEERAPYYAEDFDWSYFQSAPPDQQLKGYLRGDEEIAFHNLHPAAPVITARLPELRVRAFVRDDSGKVREVPMVLDTLFADLDKGEVSLVWRGVTPVREADLVDVQSVLLATESLLDPPRPVADYEDALEAFERDPVGIEAAKRNLLQLHENAGGGQSSEPASIALRTALAGSNVSADELRKQIATNVAATAPPAAAAALTNAAAADPDQPPIPRTSKPGAMPSTGLRKTVRQMMSRVEGVKADLQGQRLSPQAATKLQELENLPNDPRWKQVDPEYTPPAPLSTDAPGPYKNLVDRDFTGQDLSGIDLSHANLGGAVLSRAKLRGAKLVGANLRGAVLFKTDLAGADLTGADLTHANAAHVQAEHAVLRDAILEQAFFEDAVLTHASLTGARGEYPIFARANLRHIEARDVTFFRADFEGAKLEEADFLNASLIGCIFETSSAPKANLTGARITVANFAQADLSGARFTEARGERVWFFQARLDGADFGRAVLPSSHFTECSATKARFFGADLRESRFYRACLDDAEIVRANLFGADLGKAQLSRTRFTGSSLYDAKLLGASGAGCDFTDANLKRSTLERQ